MPRFEVTFNRTEIVAFELDAEDAEEAEAEFLSEGDETFAETVDITILEIKILEVQDAFGRVWPGTETSERCPVCGQPDNIGDCNHHRLEDAEVTALGGKHATEETS